MDKETRDFCACTHFMRQGNELRGTIATLLFGNRLLFLVGRIVFEGVARDLPTWTQIKRGRRTK